MNDPFADAFDPFESAPIEDNWLAKPENDNEDTTESTKETKTVTNTSEQQAKMTITLKGGAGFDAPWIVLYADDAADGLTQMQDPKLKELMEEVKKAGGEFSGGSGNAQRPQGGGQPQQQNKPPQQQAPSGETKTCQHGEMVFRSGVSKKSGKPYKAFFCPTPQGTPDQCSPQFIN